MDKFELESMRNTRLKAEAVNKTEIHHILNEVQIRNLRMIHASEWIKKTPDQGQKRTCNNRALWRNNRNNTQKTFLFCVDRS